MRVSEIFRSRGLPLSGEAYLPRSGEIKNLTEVVLIVDAKLVIVSVTHRYSLLPFWLPEKESIRWEVLLICGFKKMYLCFGITFGAFIF